MHPLLTVLVNLQGMFASVVAEPDVTFSLGLLRLSQKGSAKFKQVNDSL